MAMGNLVLSVIGIGGGGSKEYLSINPDSLLPRHCYLFDTSFESLTSGPTSQCLLWQAEKGTAFTAYCLASTRTLSGGPSHVPSSNLLGGPRVEVNVGLESRCKKNIDEGELDGNDGNVDEGGGNMVCNSSKDVINSNILPCFLFTLIWLLSGDASGASGILGQWGDSQVWRWYQRMDDGLGPHPTTMGTMTNKGKWAMERQPRVAVETEDGQWTKSNNNREQDNKGKERGEEKARGGGDMSECTMDDDCLASEKGRCFLCPGPAGPGSALISELS
jgi:hypothetical protein